MQRECDNVTIKTDPPLLRFFAIPKWILEWSLILLLLAGIPYLIVLAITPVDKHFTGILINHLDTNSYFANMQIGVRGEWLYTLPYSFQKNHPVPLFMFYILLGHLARAAHISIPLAYHLSRLLGGFILVILSYHYVSRFTQDEREQKLALFILLFTGGLGWLVIVLFGARVEAYLIPDIWILEGITFGSILGFPHFILSMIFMLILLMVGQDCIKYKNWVSGFWAIFAGMGIAFFHPQQLLVVAVVLFVTVCVEYKNNVQKLQYDLGLLSLILFPGVILAFLISRQAFRDPLLSSWLKQGNTYSPPLWSFFYYVWAYVLSGNIGHQTCYPIQIEIRLSGRSMVSISFGVALHACQFSATLYRRLAYTDFHACNTKLVS